VRIIKERIVVINILNQISDSLTSVVKENPDDEFILYQKGITHSDIPTYAKRTSNDQALDRNILYYISADQMKTIEEKTESTFECAKQSNIYISNAFFDELRLPYPRDCVKINSFPLINDNIEVYLVSDTLKYFSKEYVDKIHIKINRNTRTKYDSYLKEWSNIEIHDDFYRIDLGYAVHGLGTSSNAVFHRFRSTIFRSDKLNLLIQKNDNEMKLYVFVQRNPLFFTILNEENESWYNYVVKTEAYQDFRLKAQSNPLTNISEVSRVYQNSWRNLLAEEMMNYNSHDDYVFCPISYVECNYSNLGTLFRASHIKPYKLCNEHEAFDINNGLLLAANVDALFDKHYISINNNKKLVISFLIANDHKLLSQLHLSEDVFDLVLNENRMIYMTHHYNEFLRKEEERKKRQ
jgi:predicted restriction endonuclease